MSRLPKPARELKTTTKQNRTEAEPGRGGGTALAGAGLLIPQNSENVPGCVPLRGRLRCTHWPSCPSGCLLSSLSTLHATVALSLHVHLWEECGWGQPAPSYFPDAPRPLRWLELSIGFIPHTRSPEPWLQGRLESDPGLPCVPALPACGLEQFSLLSACVRIGFPERVCLKQGSVAWYVKSPCLSTGWRVHAPASTDSDSKQKSDAAAGATLASVAFQ